MFLDKIKRLTLIAGKGGDGVISWRREKYVPKGGPSGGNGGDGGDVILQVDSHKLSLDHFRNIKILQADNGDNGGTSDKTGKNGGKLILKIPPGTLIKDAISGDVLYDCLKDGEEILLCKGGKGGKGNIAFKSPTNRAPSQCTKGENGERRVVELELKIIADIGFVGMPNAGKSTLFSALTKIDVKIAPYPFSTLHPNVGILTFDDYTQMTFADIPGIIEMASSGKGLGIDFLRHIERTSILLFVVDISGEDPKGDLLMLQDEIKKYKQEILEKPSFIILNKIDLVETAIVENFIKSAELDKNIIFPISAKEGLNLNILIAALKCKILR